MSKSQPHLGLVESEHHVSDEETAHNSGSFIHSNDKRTPFDWPTILISTPTSTPPLHRHQLNTDDSTSIPYSSNGNTAITEIQLTKELAFAPASISACSPNILEDETQIGLLSEFDRSSHPSHIRPASITHCPSSNSINRLVSDNSPDMHSSSFNEDHRGSINSNHLVGRSNSTDAHDMRVSGTSRKIVRKAGQCVKVSLECIDGQGSRKNSDIYTLSRNTSSAKLQPLLQPVQRPLSCPETAFHRLRSLAKRNGTRDITHATRRCIRHRTACAPLGQLLALNHSLSDNTHHTHPHRRMFWRSLTESPRCSFSCDDAGWSWFRNKGTKSRSSRAWSRSSAAGELGLEDDDALPDINLIIEARRQSEFERIDESFTYVQTSLSDADSGGASDQLHPVQDIQQHPLLSEQRDRLQLMNKKSQFTIKECDSDTLTRPATVKAADLPLSRSRDLNKCGESEHVMSSLLRAAERLDRFIEVLDGHITGEASRLTNTAVDMGGNNNSSKDKVEVGTEVNGCIDVNREPTQACSYNCIADELSIVEESDANYDSHSSIGKYTKPSDNQPLPTITTTSNGIPVRMANAEVNRITTVSTVMYSPLAHDNSSIDSSSLKSCENEESEDAMLKQRKLAPACNQEASGNNRWPAMATYVNVEVDDESSNGGTAEHNGMVMGWRDNDQDRSIGELDYDSDYERIDDDLCGVRSTLRRRTPPKPHPSPAPPLPTRPTIVITGCSSSSCSSSSSSSCGSSCEHNGTCCNEDSHDSGDYQPPFDCREIRYRAESFSSCEDYVYAVPYKESDQ